MPKRASRGSLLAGLAQALLEAGELTSAGERFAEAAALARAEGDEHVEWLARVGLAFLRVRQQPEGAAEAAFREGEGAIAARGPVGDQEVLAQAWNLIAEGI